LENGNSSKKTVAAGSIGAMLLVMFAGRAMRVAYKVSQEMPATPAVSREPMAPVVEPRPADLHTLIKISEIAASIHEVEVSSVEPNSTFGDLGGNGLTFHQTRFVIEEEYGIKIPNVAMLILVAGADNKKFRVNNVTIQQFADLVEGTLAVPACRVDQ